MDNNTPKYRIVIYRYGERDRNFQDEEAQRFSTVRAAFDAIGEIADIHQGKHIVDVVSDLDDTTEELHAECHWIYDTSFIDILGQEGWFDFIRDSYSIDEDDWEAACRAWLAHHENEAGSND